MIYDFRCDATWTNAIFGSKLTAPTGSCISAMFVFVSICRHRQRKCYSKQLKHFCASTFEPPTARCRSWSISWKNRKYKQAYATIGSSSLDEGENFFAIRWKSRKLIYDAEISVRTCKFIQIARISRSLSGPRWEEKSFRHEKCKFTGSRLICMRLQLPCRHSHPRCLLLGKVNQND